MTLWATATLVWPVRTEVEPKIFMKNRDMAKKIRRRLEFWQKCNFGINYTRMANVDLHTKFGTHRSRIMAEILTFIYLQYGSRRPSWNYLPPFWTAHDVTLGGLQFFCPANAYLRPLLGGVWGFYLP